MNIERYLAWPDTFFYSKCCRDYDLNHLPVLIIATIFILGHSNLHEPGNSTYEMAICILSSPIVGRY